MQKDELKFIQRLHRILRCGFGEKSDMYPVVFLQSMFWVGTFSSINKADGYMKPYGDGCLIVEAGGSLGQVCATRRRFEWYYPRSNSCKSLNPYGYQEKGARSLECELVSQ
jgi:hypothetical protein